MDSPGDFSFSGDWYYKDLPAAALRKLYNGDSWLFKAGTQTLDAVDLIESANPGDYTPANGAVYPGSFRGQPQTIAQMVKLGVGCVWPPSTWGAGTPMKTRGMAADGYMADLLGNLGEGMAAFYTDLNGSGSSNYTGADSGGDERVRASPARECQSRH